MGWRVDNDEDEVRQGGRVGTDDVDSKLLFNFLPLAHDFLEPFLDFSVEHGAGFWSMFYIHNEDRQNVNLQFAATISQVRLLEVVL